MNDDPTHRKPLTVGLLSPGWPAEAMANGIVSYTASIRRGLVSLGARCHVLTRKLMGEPPDPMVHEVRIGNGSLKSKLMWRLQPHAWPQQAFCTALGREVDRLGREDGLALFELEESYGWARLLAARCRVPLVVRLHGPWFLNGPANGVALDASFHRRDRWERAGLLASTAVSAPSHDVLAQTRAHFGLQLAGAQVIPNPVETVAPADRWTLDGCDRNRIVFIGRFDRHKGGDTMIDAFVRIAREFPHAQLDFVGPDRGCTDDAGRTWSIEQYLRERTGDDVRPRIMVHGFQPAGRSTELRKRALVTVAPSRYETFGIAAAEAMAAGCPLVVGGAGALTELVQDGQNGRVARAGDGGNLADTIIGLMRNPQWAAELGTCAARDAEARYAPDVVARQTLAFYDGVLSAKRAGTQRPGAAANRPQLADVFV